MKEKKKKREKQSIDANKEITEMLKLSGKDSKATFKNISVSNYKHT